MNDHREKRPQTKVAIIGSKGYPYVFSGYETLVKELVRHLADRIELHIYCHSPLFDSRPARVDGAHLHYMPTIAADGYCQLSNSTASTLHALRTGIDRFLFLNLATAPLAWLAHRLGKHVVLNTDGMEWERPIWRGMGAEYFRLAAKIVGRASYPVICDSAEIAAVYRDKVGVSKHRIEVIGYGANGPTSGGDEALDGFGLSPGEYYLVVGRMVPDNNLDLIVEAYRSSGASRPLAVVGDVLYQNRLSERIKERRIEGVRLLGFVRDPGTLSALYSGCRAYLHGHEHGGINPTLLEAVAHRTACAVLDTPFSREVLSTGEGLFFAKSKGDLCRVIWRLESSDDLVKVLRKRTAEANERIPKWEEIAERYAHLVAPGSPKRRQAGDSPRSTHAV